MELGECYSVHARHYWTVRNVHYWKRERVEWLLHLYTFIQYLWRKPREERNISGVNFTTSDRYCLPFFWICTYTSSLQVLFVSMEIYLQPNNNTCCHWICAAYKCSYLLTYWLIAPGINRPCTNGLEWRQDDKTWDKRWNGKETRSQAVARIADRTASQQTLVISDCC